MVVALRNLADALAAVSAGHEDAVKVRGAAQKLEASRPSSLEHANLVKDGLEAALQTLASKRAPSGHQTEYRKSVETVRRWIEAMNVDVPLLEQRKTVVEALRAATNAVYLSRGSEPPFSQAEPAAQGTMRMGNAKDELEMARADVLKLGQSKWSKWEDTRNASARALSSIADVIEASFAKSTRRDRIAKIRFQAQRLKSSNQSSFGQAGWVKAGLTSALDALDATQSARPKDEQTVVAPWIRAARQAADGIDKQRFLSFQRAAVQDGFRATVDALFIASQAASLCR